MSRAPIEKIEKEADLCALFIHEFNKLPDWTCYPEAAGFDILVVHTDGRQIGVEAKLSLNVKVADQILPNHYEENNEAPGPDYRMVIVSKITDASAGIVKMLERQGVTVLLPRSNWTIEGDRYTFDLKHKLLEVSGRAPFYDRYMFDWNPPERCQVPVMVTNLPAGVPAPVRLTPWKESALKVIALLRRQGFITAKQIASHGIGVTAWTQPASSLKPSWLAKGTVRGTWIETEHLPAFDKQHPEVYALAVEGINAAQPALELTA
ncbi:hypothetical protein [Pseudomonas sp. UMAB-40]|uniref:hypothetical protein n=1 Tax=Pseudomonas sp. UMAB-40 TaxID=1365407 RepID=UPI001C590742|nr:hypothetical protein [Pseudomonas sp. UMAB-40]